MIIANSGDAESKSFSRAECMGDGCLGVTAYGHCGGDGHW